jgi:hypothetical protein
VGQSAELTQGQSDLSDSLVDSAFEQVPDLGHQIGQVLVGAHAERLTPGWRRSDTTSSC